MNAIKIKTKKAIGDYDLGCSKMLGNPTLPKGMMDELPDDAIFLMQIKLDDIKDLDKDNKLPHTGYLYFFLRTENGIYDLKPIVKYSKEDPEEVIEDFNASIPDFEQFTQDFLIEFELCDESDIGNKLLGCPGDWQFSEEPDELLFQLDPMDNDEMGLFPTFDGMIYLFFGKDKKNFKDVKILEDFS